MKPETLVDDYGDTGIVQDAGAARALEFSRKRVRSVRTMRDDEIDQVVEMGVHFLESPAYRDVSKGFKRERLREAVQFAQQFGIVLVAETASGALVGMLVAVALEHPFSGEKVTEEWAWWVEPGASAQAGARLFLTWIQWAKSSGCACVKTLEPAHSTRNLCEFYQRLGFAAVETAYVLRLNRGP